MNNESSAGAEDKRNKPKPITFYPDQDIRLWYESLPSYEGSAILNKVLRDYLVHNLQSDGSMSIRIGIPDPPGSNAKVWLPIHSPSNFVRALEQNVSSPIGAIGTASIEFKNVEHEWTIEVEGFSQDAASKVLERLERDGFEIMTAAPYVTGSKPWIAIVAKRRKIGT